MRAGVVCILMTSCGLFPSLGDLTSTDGGDAASDASVDAVADAVSDTNAPDVTTTTDGGCPGTAGPVSVVAGGVCIDATEVTNAQYKQFLAANVGSSRPECAWKTTYVPKGGWPAPGGTDDYPVAYADWCDADAFCVWAGKRLCGRISGGPIAPTSANNPSLDQWSAACSHAGDGQHAFPYGNTFQPSACNGPEHDAGATLPVGFLKTCTGGYPSLVDMVGNVYEWEDGCTASTGATDPCVQRSGSFFDPPGSTQTCGYSRTTQRNFADNDIGFRCCGP